MARPAVTAAGVADRSGLPDSGAGVAAGTLEIQVSPGVEVYSFTFG